VARRLEGKVIVVTGAGRGIGLALAKAFAREGARLALCSKSSSAVAAAAALKKAGADAWGAACDVSVEKQARAFMAGVERRYGRVDALVNGAGVLGPVQELAKCTSAQWRAVLGVNVLGTAHMIAAAVPSMKARKSGVVVNLTSGAGRRGTPLVGPYCASKFAVEGLTQVAALELKEHGIRVYAVNPGPTRTDMRKGYAPKEDPATVKAPETVAEAFIRLVRDEPPGLSGRTLDLGPDGALAV
jgi:NAD(P)-dependent dehydrogenase (short-subunit alcohol dehydrogenase family)